VWCPTALSLSAFYLHERLRGTKNYLNNAAPVPAPAAEAASAPTPVVAETLASGTSAAAKAFYTPVFKNANTTAFQVAYPLPLINFALQPSWAGRLPVSGSASETRELFFWYWPSSQSTASDTLTIWLNGGTLVH
jgi:carboxypeptidase C (cathepsin A)